MDVNAFRVKTLTSIQKPDRSRVVKLRMGRFIKGPIDWDWICRAAPAGGHGRALDVALALLLEHGIKGENTIALSYKRLSELGVDRHAARRGLAALEKAGLVTVERHPGRYPRVTILQ